MATQELKRIFKKSLSLIEDYGARDFLARSSNRGDTNISELIDKCGGMNLIDLVEVISELEKKLSNSYIEDEYWLDPIREELNLHITFSELGRAQLDAEIVARNSMACDRQLRSMFVARLMNLAKIYSEHGRQSTGGNTFYTFNNSGPIEKQKNFVYLARLDGILDLIGIRTSTARRMYIKGVCEERRNKKYYDIVPLRVLCSPMCVFDYIAYLKKTWYKAHVYDVEEEKKARQLKFSYDYYDEKINDTLCLTQSLIKGRTNGESRLSLEIPQAFGNYDMMVWYCWGSSNIRSMLRMGILKEGWPVLYKLLSLLVQESKCNIKVKSALRKSKKMADRMWKESSVPDRGKTDYESISPIIGQVCPKKLENIKNWLFL